MDVRCTREDDEWRAAVLRDDVEQVRRLVARGGGVREQIRNTLEESYFPPLYLAVTNGRTAVARELVGRRDCHVNATSDLGYTALHAAASECDIDMMRAILAREDADPNIANLGGETPLNVAVLGNCESGVRALLDDPRLDEDSVTRAKALYLKWNSPFGLCYFSPAAASSCGDAHVGGREGYTALEAAALDNCDSCVRQLLRDPDADEACVARAQALYLNHHSPFADTTSPTSARPELEH